MARTLKPPINYTTGLAGNVKTLYLDLFGLLSLFPLAGCRVRRRSWKKESKKDRQKGKREKKHTHTQAHERLFSLSARAGVVGGSSAQYSSIFCLYLACVRLYFGVGFSIPTLIHSDLEWRSNAFNGPQTPPPTPPFPPSPPQNGRRTVNPLWIRPNAASISISPADGKQCVGLSC